MQLASLTQKNIYLKGGNGSVEILRLVKISSGKMIQFWGNMAMRIKILSVLRVIQRLVIDQLVAILRYN